VCLNLLRELPAQNAILLDADLPIPVLSSRLRPSIGFAKHFPLYSSILPVQNWAPSDVTNRTHNLFYFNNLRWVITQPEREGRAQSLPTCLYPV
jgi:hypothetical protein